MAMIVVKTRAASPIPVSSTDVDRFDSYHVLESLNTIQPMRMHWESGVQWWPVTPVVYRWWWINRG